jgi:hypothetical protein
MNNAFCQQLLIGEVPPIPPHIEQDTPLSTVNSRRTSRRSNQEPEFNSFPDDLSEIRADHPAQVPPTADCRFLPQELFQLPSEIVDKVKNLNLGTMDEESVDSSIAEFNYATTCNEASMLRPPVLTGSTMRDSVMHESPSNGLLSSAYAVGEVFGIAPNEDFDMLQAFPGSLISMTRIIHFCRMAGVPLYLVDGFIKIISEEVGASRLNLNDYPSHCSTMKDLSHLFHVPLPRTITIPLERTLNEQKVGEFPVRLPSLHFPFLSSCKICCPCRKFFLKLIILWLT